VTTLIGRVQRVLRSIEKERIARLSSDSAWSLSGSVIGVGAGFVVVKITTSLVRTTAYGDAALALGVVALLNAVVTGPLLVFHNRLYFEHRANAAQAAGYARYFRKVLFCGSVVAVIAYSLVAAGAEILTGRAYATVIGPTVLLLFAQPSLSMLANYLEAERRQRSLAILNVSQKALVPAWLFLLLYAGAAQSAAVILAQVCSVVLLLAVYRRVYPRAPAANSTAIDAPGIVQTLRASFWSVAGGYILMWVMTTVDRYFIEALRSTSEVGVYAMNYGVWSMPFLLLNGWLEVVTRPLLYSRAARQDGRGVAGVVVARLLVSVTSAAVGAVLLILLSDSIGQLLLGTKYWVGRLLVTTLAVAHVFFVGGYAVTAYFLAIKQTTPIFTASLLGAVTNVTLNMVLIRRLGIEGAALATLGAYVIWFVALGVFAMRYFGTNVKWPLRTASTSVP
jgi:O-antigen/teichoic acid export membrane protein